jgi:hypothetical protein
MSHNKALALDYGGRRFGGFSSVEIIQLEKKISPFDLQIAYRLS